MKGKHVAFVLIDVEPGRDKRVLDRLMKYDEVVEGHLIAGQYDILAVLELELYGTAIFTSPQEAVSNFVIDKVRKLRDVRDTNTIYPTYSVTKRE